MLVTGLSAQWSPQVPSRGQDRWEIGEAGALQGRIVATGGEGKDLQVLLIDQFGNERAVAEVSVAGTFSFSGVPHGHYALRLLHSGKPVSEQFVTVEDAVERVDLNLPLDRREDSGDGTVSVSELRHKPPAQALKDAQKGESALRKGKVEEAIGHFERSLETDPDFAAVRERLAGLYLQQHDDARAVTHLERLLKQRASSVWAWINLSAARFRLGRVVEAEAAARRALALDATQKMGRYLLGLSLASQDKNPDEALASLRETCDKFPRGHLTAARILVKRGDIAGARDQLESYLGSDPPEDTSEVKAWLARHARPQVSASAAGPGAR
jgi:tetratricopeptide (TPR) repeat protein